MRMRLLVATLAVAGSLLPAGNAMAQGKSRDLITREEILESAVKNQDLLKAVRNMRPHFLRPPRGVRSMSGAGAPRPVMLYVDGNRQADVNALAEILTTDAAEVRYLEPSKAQDAYGITHSGGAILVTLYRGDRTAPPRPGGR